MEESVMRHSGCRDRQQLIQVVVIRHEREMRLVQVGGRPKIFEAEAIDGAAFGDVRRKRRTGCRRG